MQSTHLSQALDVRSIMFVPALAEAFLAKAHTRGADAIIVDLEDSIPPELKGRAREAAPAAIARIAAHLPVYLRVNNDPEHLHQDLAQCMAPGLTGVLLPKAESAAQVRDTAAAMNRLARSCGMETPPALALLVETPLGIHLLAELAQSDPAVVALVFGSEDYSALLGTRPTPEAMTVPAQLLCIAARARGLAAWGVAGTIVEISDSDLLRQVADASRQLGFTGSIAVNPKQIPVFNAAFGVTEDELMWAREVDTVFQAALAEGRAAVGHRGRMIDTPVAVRARRILARHERATARAEGVQ